MAAAEEVQFSLKVMMIKESNKVLYAEVDSDFADVLLSFLTLPLGTIVRLLIKHYGNNAPILGSLNSLYAGLQNMDGSHFWTEAGKLMLLNPINSSEVECRRLKLQIDDTPPIQYFMCGNWQCVSMYDDVKCLCPNSRITMTRRDVEIEAQSGDKSVFTVQAASFLLTDDLCILTNTSASLLDILKLNDIDDTSVLEERTLIVGLKEIMELLKGSLVSKTPITDIILGNSSAAATLNKRKKFSASAKYEPDVFPQTNQSDNGSVSPGNNTCLWNINNLYGNISNLEVGGCMKSRETITRLLEPQIPPYYLSNHQIFSLSQQNSPEIRTNDWGRLFLSSSIAYHKLRIIDPKGQDCFVKGPTTFTVTDDLVVSTPSSTFIVSTLNQMKIPISDVEEQELEIGMAEALSILKASLTSTCALSEGLNPFLKRQPKQKK